MTHDVIADRDGYLATLDKILEQRAMIEKLDKDEQGDWAPILARTAVGLAARLCGPAVLHAAYGNNPNPNNRAACLNVLSERLSIGVIILYVPTAQA